MTDSKNLVENGSFERGTAGWELIGDVKGGELHGRHAALFTKPTDALRQEVKASEPGVYSFTFSAAHDAGMSNLASASLTIWDGQNPTFEPGFSISLPIDSTRWQRSGSLHFRLYLGGKVVITLDAKSHTPGGGKDGLGRVYITDVELVKKATS
jgi:hypothetical protein